jgi:hypothetical protein
LTGGATAVPNGAVAAPVSDQPIACLKNCLVRPSPSAASGELAVYDDTRQAANSMLFCPRCDVRVMHVMNFDVVVRARNAPDQVHRLVTRRATGTEDLNLSPLALGHPSLSILGFQQARVRLLL